MTVSTKKYMAAFAATAVLALGLYGCGGGGSGPATGGDQMMPGDGDGDGVMPGDGDGMMPDPMPDPQAVADAVELVASWAVKDADGNTVSGHWYRDFNSSGNQEHLTSTHRVGSYASPVISYDANGPQFNIAIIQRTTAEPLQTDPGARAHRYINTYEIGEELEGGLTTSREVITDHGLGSEWHAEELTNDYESGGFLEIGVATDVKSTDGAVDQWQIAADVPYNILLDDAPSIPAGHDFLVVWFDWSNELSDFSPIGGSLDGVEGSFTCDRPEGCWFYDDHEMGRFVAASEGISFTPDGGTAQSVTPIVPGATEPADYLAFGYWYYQPEDVTAAADYDFGVFASGGDPFETANLAGLTGSATYAGSAMGGFYVDDSSGSPASGLFTASVSLTADFGDGTETGTISGTINNFDWSEEGVESSLPAEVYLGSDNWAYAPEGYGHNYTPDEYGRVRDMSNIFDTRWRMDPAPRAGGHVLGITDADVGETHWVGEWNSAFFGNGASVTDHPTSIAGTFIVSDHSTAGLAGSFGAHRQDDSQ